MDGASYEAQDGASTWIFRKVEKVGKPGKSKPSEKRLVFEVLPRTRYLFHFFRVFRLFRLFSTFRKTSAVQERGWTVRAMRLQDGANACSEKSKKSEKAAKSKPRKSASFLQCFQEFCIFSNFSDFSDFFDLPTFLERHRLFKKEEGRCEPCGKGRNKCISDKFETSTASEKAKQIEKSEDQCPHLFRPSQSMPRE